MMKHLVDLNKIFSGILRQREESPERMIKNRKEMLSKLISVSLIKQIE